MAKRKKFTKYNGYKINSDLLNDMFVYDDYLMKENVDGGNYYYGYTADNYVEQLNSGTKVNDANRQFNKNFSVAHSKGYNDLNFLEKVNSVLPELNEARSKLSELKTPVKKFYEPSFMFNSRMNKYNEEKLGYENKISELNNRIVPSYGNISQKTIENINSNNIVNDFSNVVRDQPQEIKLSDSNVPSLNVNKNLGVDFIKDPLNINTKKIPMSDLDYYSSNRNAAENIIYNFQSNNPIKFAQLHKLNNTKIDYSINPTNSPNFDPFTALKVQGSTKLTDDYEILTNDEYEKRIKEQVSGINEKNKQMQTDNWSWKPDENFDLKNSYNDWEEQFDNNKIPTNPEGHRISIISNANQEEPISSIGNRKINYDYVDNDWNQNIYNGKVPIEDVDENFKLRTNTDLIEFYSNKNEVLKKTNGVLDNAINKYNYNNEGKINFSPIHNANNSKGVYKDFSNVEEDIKKQTKSIRTFQSETINDWTTELDNENMPEMNIEENSKAIPFIEENKRNPNFKEVQKIEEERAEYFDDVYGESKNITPSEIKRTDFHTANNDPIKLNDLEDEIENNINNVNNYSKKINDFNSESYIDSEKLNETFKQVSKEGNEKLGPFKDEKIIEDNSFKERFGIDKENYSDEVGKAFDERDAKVKEKLMNDDLYFQYDKNDDFYKNVNILDKKTEKKSNGINLDGLKDVKEETSFANIKGSQSTTKKSNGINLDGLKDVKEETNFANIRGNQSTTETYTGGGDTKEAYPGGGDAKETYTGAGDAKETYTDGGESTKETYTGAGGDTKEAYTGGGLEEDNFDQNYSSKKYTRSKNQDGTYTETEEYTYEAKNKNQKNFDYNTPTKDTINAKEYAKQIYGKDVTDAQVKQLVEGYAESDSGIKKQMYEKGFDFGKVNMKTTGDNAESIGRVIADLKGDGVINDSGVFDPEAAIKAVDGINGPFNKESVLKGFKSQAYRNRFNKEYKDYQNDLFRMSEDLNNSKKDVKDILKKIQNEETLTPEEAKAFHKHQVKLKTYHDNIVNWAEEKGFDPESIFGERFKSKGKGKDKYKGTRDWMFNTDSINNINNELDLLDTRVNLETGKYTTKKTEPKDALKEDLNSLIDNNGYKTAYDNSKIKDNYLDYLGENKEALTNDTAKKLYNLQQKDGVDIGDEGRQVLQGLAIAHEGKLDEKNGAVTKLNTALETLSSENYMNIKDDNIDRIGKGLVYKDNKYQLDMDKLNLTDEQKNSEAFKKIIESDNIGTEDLKGIFDASTVNNYIQGKNIDEKEFNKIIGEKVSGLEDSKYDTGLNIKEQLKRRGIKDNKIIDEIANAKNNGTDNLSAEAKVAIATLKDPLDQNEINFGSISKDKMKEYINNNKGFFGDPKDIENMNEKELYGLFGKAFEGTVTDGKLAKGYDFKVKGKDVTSAEGFTDFYNSILGKDGKDLDWDKVFSSLGATEEGKAQFKDAFEWMKGKKGQKEFKQMNIANSARDYLVKMFNEASGNENIDAKTKEQIKKHAEILKTKKMDDVASKVDVDSITKDIGKFDKIGKEAGKGIADSIKGGGKWKTIGGAALAIGGLGALGMFASNAAEERERKRQEMQQLMMAQNQTIRGGY